MTTHEFHVIIERDAEGYYVASVPALRGCHTQAHSLDTLLERTREAIELCLEDEQELATGMAKILRDCELTDNDLLKLL